MTQQTPYSPLERAENIFSMAILGTMALLPIAEVMSRTLLGQGISGSIPIVQHLTLWIALAGAALSSRSNRHLALSTQSLLPERSKNRVRLFTSTLAFGIVCCLVAASVDLVLIEHRAGDVVAWGIPLSLIHI